MSSSFLLYLALFFPEIIWQDWVSVHLHFQGVSRWHKSCTCSSHFGDLGCIEGKSHILGPSPLPSNIQANEGLVRDPPNLKMSQATWEVTSNLGRGTNPMYTVLCPKVGKYRPSLAFGQSDGWEGGMEAEAIDELRKKLRRERFSGLVGGGRLFDG